MIRPVELTDAESICEIYNHYVLNSTITFEENKVTVEELKSRIQDIVVNLPYIVYEIDGKVLGYAYATKWKARSAYRFSVELTVYVGKNSKGQGIGTALYDHLIKDLTSRNIHSLISGIALPNDASVALHEKLGFVKVAHFKEVGYKLNTWVDVGYWQYNIKP